MRLFHIDEHLARARVAPIRDRCDRWAYAIHLNAVHLGCIFFHIAIAENADHIRVGGQLLYDQIVVFALFLECAIASHFGTDCSIFVFVGFFQSLHRCVGLATGFHDQFMKGIARTRCRGWAINGNWKFWQRRVDVGPQLCGLRFPKWIGSKRFIDVGGCKRELGALVRFCQRKAVNAHLNFDYVLNAIFLAIFKFALFHTTRCVGDVRAFCADTFAELFNAAASSVGFKNRRFARRICFCKSFGRCLCERKYRGGADDADFLTRPAGGSTSAGLVITCRKRKRAYGYERNFLHHIAVLVMDFCVSNYI